MPWFPRYNSRGEIITERHPGEGGLVRYQSQWLTDERTIWHDGTNLVIDGKVTPNPAFNELAAAAAKWAGSRLSSTPFLLTSWGETIHGAGSPALSRNGVYFAFIADRQTLPRVVLRFDETELELDRGAIADLRVSNLCAVWSRDGQTYGHWFGVKSGRIQVAPAEFRPIPFDVGGVPWVLSTTHTGFIVRPFGETLGYRFDNGGQAYYPDACAIDGGLLEVAFTNDRGELARKGWTLDDTRIDLGGPIVIDPPPPPPPPPPPIDPPGGPVNNGIVNGVCVDLKAFFFSLVQSAEGQPCGDFRAKMKAIEPELFKYGLGQQTDGGGGASAHVLRGRLFYPWAGCRNASPRADFPADVRFHVNQSPNCCGIGDVPCGTVDVVNPEGTQWAWTMRGPAYVPLDGAADPVDPTDPFDLDWTDINERIDERIEVAIQAHDTVLLAKVAEAVSKLLVGVQGLTPNDRKKIDDVGAFLALLASPEGWQTGRTLAHTHLLRWQAPAAR